MTARRATQKKPGSKKTAKKPAVKAPPTRIQRGTDGPDLVNAIEEMLRLGRADEAFDNMLGLGSLPARAGAVMNAKLMEAISKVDAEALAKNPHTMEMYVKMFTGIVDAGSRAQEALNEAPLLRAMPSGVGAIGGTIIDGGPASPFADMRGAISKAMTTHKA